MAHLAVYQDTQVSHFNFTNTQLAENFCPKSSIEQAKVELEESSDSVGRVDLEAELRLTAFDSKWIRAG